MGFDQKTAEILVKVYAVFYWIETFFGVIGGLVLFFGGSFMATMMPFAGDAGLTNGMFGGMNVGIAVLTIAIAVFAFFVGLHLWQHKKWARIAALILSILSVLSFPIGTLIGGFGIYLFGFDDGIKALFK